MRLLSTTNINFISKQKITSFLSLVLIICGISSLFMKESVPVCGGSLGIERIIMLLRDQLDFETETSAFCYVTVWDEVSQSNALRLASVLRASGVSAEIDLAGGKLGRQLRVANERGCRVVIVQGPDEKAAGEVTIKDMGSGSQQRVPEVNAPRVIKELSRSSSQI